MRISKTFYYRHTGECSSEFGRNGNRKFKNARRTDRNLQLESLRSRYLETHEWFNGHLWIALGLQHCSLSPNGTPPFTVTQVTNLATTTLAPAGTPLWHPRKDDFAPRLGLAWQVHSNLVVRAGAGIFYDLGYADVTNALISFPYVQQSFLFGTSFPLTGNSAAPPPFTTSPPAASMSVVDPNHVLPRTYEWNAAAERSFSRADVLTLTYVGAAGRKLMRRDIYIAPNPNFTGRLDVQSNGGASSYNALQAQYRHRLSDGLQHFSPTLGGTP